METKNRTVDIEKVCKSIDNGSLCFEISIQREGGQFTSTQQSLLIDSVIRGYKIPAVWITKTQTEQFEKNSVIDGKQRLTTIYDFVNDKFKLDKCIKSVTITATPDNELDEDLTIELAGKTFSKLPKIIQNIILNYDIDEIQMFGYTNRQVEEQFYRLNNGSLFTKAQKANVSLGCNVADKMKTLESLDFWARTGFSKAQRKHAEITSCIIQCFMLLNEEEYSNYGENSVIDYAEKFKKSCTEEDIENMKMLIETLDACMTDDDVSKKFLKKLNIPALIMCTQTYLYYKDKDMITPEQYTKFLADWVDIGAECSGYLENCGQGSQHRTKVDNRVKIICDWFVAYVNKINSGEEETVVADGEEADIGA